MVSNKVVMNFLLFIRLFVFKISKTIFYFINFYFINKTKCCIIFLITVVSVLHYNTFTTSLHFIILHFPPKMFIGKC